MTKKDAVAMGRAFALAEQTAYAPEAIVSKTLLDKKSGTLTIFAFDAGQGLSEHTAPFDASVLIIDGEAKITLDKKPHAVKAGDMLIMPAHVPHALFAEKPFKMLLIMIRS